jgi:CheY-like chemotaxis protein
VIMDLNMPGISGAEATRRIRELSPRTEVVMLTVWTAEDDIVDALEAGAAGYLLKDAPGDEVLRAVTPPPTGLSPHARGGANGRRARPPDARRRRRAAVRSHGARLRSLRGASEIEIEFSRACSRLGLGTRQADAFEWGPAQDRLMRQVLISTPATRATRTSTSP